MNRSLIRAFIGGAAAVFFLLPGGAYSQEESSDQISGYGSGPFEPDIKPETGEKFRIPEPEPVSGSGTRIEYAPPVMGGTPHFISDDETEDEKSGLSPNTDEDEDEDES